MTLATHQLTRVDAGCTRLADVTVAFAPGDLHVLIGPNGSGKTSLLQALAGDLAPGSGRVSWQGRDLNRFDRRGLARLRAVLPQQMPEHLPYRVDEILVKSRVTETRIVASVLSLASGESEAPEPGRLRA